jgi:hypothetical protein
MPMPRLSDNARINPYKATLRTSMIGLTCLLSGLMLLGGCKPKSDAETLSASQQAPANASVAQTPSAAPESPPSETASRQNPKSEAAPKSRETAPAGKAVSIAGGWVNAGGACDSGASVFFNPDGTYMSEGEKGTWALSGKTLTVTTSSTIEGEGSSIQGPDESTGDSGEKAVLTVLSVTDDAARVVLSNGSNASWTRCNS